MTTITSMQVLLNMVDQTIENRTSEAKQLESAIADIAVKANFIYHGIANMPLDCIYGNYQEAVKYINKLSKKYFKMVFFKEMNESAIFEVLSQHGIDYKHQPVDLDRLIYVIKNA